VQIFFDMAAKIRTIVGKRALNNYSSPVSRVGQIPFLRDLPAASNNSQLSSAIPLGMERSVE
jgi:hypothetical protein